MWGQRVIRRSTCEPRHPAGSCGLAGSTLHADPVRSLDHVGMLVSHELVYVTSGHRINARERGRSSWVPRPPTIRDPLVKDLAAFIPKDNCEVA